MDLLRAAALRLPLLAGFDTAPLSTVPGCSQVAKQTPHPAKVTRETSASPISSSDIARDHRTVVYWHLCYIGLFVTFVTTYLYSASRVGRDCRKPD